MAEPIVVVPYDPTWPQQFGALAHPLRAALGATAVRIDHIGSTAVTGLDAKPIIDVQISVRDFMPFEAIQAPLEQLGYRWRADNSDRMKRYFRESAGAQRTHIHVRRAGSWSEQFALLFRDYLREHPAVARQYATLKWRLAQQYREQREQYVDAKAPFIWQIMAQADDWAQTCGWQSGPSDA